MNLFRTLEAREIECRVQQVRANGLSLLLYKDARCDQTVLDETVGPMNWMRQHTRDNANCIVSIWDEKKCAWVSKEDTGTESNTEAQKGLASDSFKRACVNWGIGRELYTAPFIWIPSNRCVIQEKNGRYTCYDRFKVSAISYNDRREIAHLVIVNEKTGVEVFAYVGLQSAQPNPNAFLCDRCGKEITGTVERTERRLFRSSLQRIAARVSMAVRTAIPVREFCFRYARSVNRQRRRPNEGPG